MIPSNMILSNNYTIKIIFAVSQNGSNVIETHYLLEYQGDEDTDNIETTFINKKCFEDLFDFKKSFPLLPDKNIDEYINQKVSEFINKTTDNTVSSEDIMECSPDKYHPDGYKFNKLTGKIIK